MAVSRDRPGPRIAHGAGFLPTTRHVTAALQSRAMPWGACERGSRVRSRQMTSQQQGQMGVNNVKSFITTRRTFLKVTAAGVGVLAAPAIISHKALASSGEINFMGWAGYPKLAEVVFPAFEKSTGI